MVKNAHELKDGTKRVKKIDLKQYAKKGKAWLLSSASPNYTKKAIKAYADKKKISTLIDDLAKEFLKGFVSNEGKVSGSRISLLPTGKKLARGGFSLFAKNLKFNFDDKYEWDVMYENASGSKTYLYAEDKIHLEKEKKAKLVDKFAKFYPKILKLLEKDLKKKKSVEHLALLTLIKTYIRVGNLEYYNHNGHKGLTTLQKKDIKIRNNDVTFDFVGKDGVPHVITKQFPSYYIAILTNRLTSIKPSQFVFAGVDNHPLHSSDFTDILYGYTKQHFYPHIIRSFHADITCKDFLTKNKNKKLSKGDVDQKLLEVASSLGHKKFNKKKKEWQISYKVTIDNYIRPKFVESMRKLIVK